MARRSAISQLNISAAMFFLGALLDLDDHAASQVFGAARRTPGSSGITWPSIRYPGGHCIAVFGPDILPIPAQGAHCAYHWIGAPEITSSGWKPGRFLPCLKGPRISVDPTTPPTQIVETPDKTRSSDWP